MTRHLALLRDVVQAVRVVSPESYSWLGRPAFRIPRSQARTLSAEAARVRMTFALANQLYRDFYAPGRVEAAGVERHTRPSAAPPDHVARLLADLRLPEHTWQTGWTVQGVAGRRIGVRRGDITLWVADAHCAVEGGEPRPGRSVSVLLPSVSSAFSPGFLLVNGQRLPDPDPEETMVRIYWNLRWAGTGEFLASVTHWLGGTGTGYVVKILTAVEHQQRRDSAVLYLTASEFARAATVLRAIADELHDDLRPGTPAFTEEVARGVGVAEAPGNGASFGQARCHVLAESILAAHEIDPTAADDERLDLVAAGVEDRGVRLDAPHLNPGSTAEYALPVGMSRSPSRRTRERAEPDGRVGLPVVGALARHLCDDAVWDRGRCNWIGFRAESGASSSARATFGALGPDLYEGGSGIALFLAEAARRLDDERARHTALGAIRAALDASAAPAEGTSAGLYCGPVGVAYAAARIGVALDHPDLLDAAHRLAADSVRHSYTCTAPDLLNGQAGQIVGLLALADLLADRDLVEWAGRSGERLFTGARRHSQHIWSWRSPGSGTRCGLTGYAHGAAGIAHAFVELHAATGDEQYRAAAGRAFAYERTLFSSAHGNWPDLRGAAGRGPVTAHPYRTEWCHGSAGIALSRSRAYDVLGGPVLLDEARTGLLTTAQAVRHAASAGVEDHSLCHGVSGQAEALLALRRHADPASEVDDALDAVTSVDPAIASGRRPWPCGIPTGAEVPGLMLGLAGIGWFHLRLDDPHPTPSILLPTAGLNRAGPAE